MIQPCARIVDIKSLKMILTEIKVMSSYLLLHLHYTFRLN